MKREPLSLAALRAKSATTMMATTSEPPLTTPTALLRVLATTEVGDLVADLEDDAARKAYASLLSRVVALRDGSAS